jgi:hypothetical protein
MPALCERTNISMSGLSPSFLATKRAASNVRFSIRYIRDGFFAARTYTDLADLNRRAYEWITTRSAERKWVEDPSHTVRDAFDDERGRLLILPEEPFPAHERLDVEIGKTPYARFYLNDSSALER